MALPSILSDKGLAKFRTKLCERLLATGACVFGDKCQYSHSDRPRRNSQKVQYQPRRCANPDTCELGAECGFAHSRDEEVYHPLVYKTSVCAGGADCGGYYCPMAHSNDELRSVDRHPRAEALRHEFIDTAPPASRNTSRPVLPRAEGGTGGTGDTCVEVDGAATSSDQLGVGVLPSGQSRPAASKSASRGKANRGRASRGSDSSKSVPGEHTIASDLRAPASAVQISGDEQATLESIMDDADAWWYAGDQRDLRVCIKEIVPSPTGDGDSLMGGILRPGLFSGKCVAGQSDSVVRCQVKLMTISRGDSQIAAQVVKEAKRWIAHCDAHGRSQGAFVLRRTVATTVLALPEWSATLGQSLRAAQLPPVQEVRAQWPLVVTLASWTKQLVMQLQDLHMEGIAHLCIGPQTITVDASGALHLGDFMGKIRALRLFESGWKGKSDDAWSMWYPPEVHRLVSGIECDSTWRKIDHIWVDSWQLGVCLFYMLTGEHPFGDRRDPATVCNNIVADRRVNRPLLEQLPMFADLISRLTERCPEQRLSSAQAGKHPVLWSSEDAARFAGPLLQNTKSPLWSAGGKALWAWLRHIPQFAVLAHPAGCHPAPAANVDILTRLCDRALNDDSDPRCRFANLGLEDAILTAPSAAPTPKRPGHYAGVAPGLKDARPLLMTVPLPSRQTPTKESTPSGATAGAASIRNWQGSPPSHMEVLAAPPGLEEFAATARPLASAPAPLHQQELPLLGTHPKTAQPANPPGVAIGTAYGMTENSVLPPPPRRSLAEYEILRAQASRLSQEYEFLLASMPPAPFAPDFAQGMPSPFMGYRPPYSGIATGMSESALALAQATGHDPGMVDFSTYSTLSRLAEPGFGPMGSDAVSAYHQYGMPYLELPGYLQNLTLAQRAMLEQQHQRALFEQHQAWVHHQAMLEQQAHHQALLNAYAHRYPAPPPSTSLAGASPLLSSFGVHRESSHSAQASTPKSGAHHLMSDFAYTPEKLAAQVPSVQPDVLSLLECGGLRYQAAAKADSVASETREARSTPASIAPAAGAETLGSVEARLEQLVATLGEEAEQAVPATGDAGELGCLPVDLLYAMEGRIHGSV